MVWSDALMAVVASGTVVHIPFPSETQRKSLESDGLALLRIASTGDASGGNVLHTFAGRAGFLYVLRAISAEMQEDGGVNANPDVEVRLDAQWMADQTAQAQGDWYSVLSMANTGATGATVRRVAGGSFNDSLANGYPQLLLGTIARTGTFDILAMNHRENVTNNTYISYAMFEAYRLEALTVPKIQDTLRTGLVR